MILKHSKLLKLIQPRMINKPKAKLLILKIKILQ